MRKKLQQNWLLLCDNKGSSIVTILVTMFFVISLGATLMYMSYTGFLMKTAEREGVENFYDAAAVMDEIRAGVQQIASDAIANSFRTVILTEDPSTVESDFHLEFTNAVLDEISSTSGRPELDDLLEPIYGRPTAVKGNFNPEILIPFVQGLTFEKDEDNENLYKAIDHGNAIYEIKPQIPKDGWQMTVYPAVDEEGDYINAPGKIVLEDISVNFTDSVTGFQSEITTDITINMPAAEFSGSGTYISDTLDYYTIIANQGVEASGQSLDINGSAYIGNLPNDPNTSLEITNNFSLNGEAFLTGGIILTRGDNSNISINTDSELWTQNITIENGGRLEVNQGATVNVANDLNLNGNGSEAIINGSYVGFGSSENAGADNNSAILIQGENVTLDIDGAQELALAGQSYINSSERSDKHVEIMMGESISVKTNQLAYLIPREFLEEDIGTFVDENPVESWTPLSSNPLIISNEEAGDLDRKFRLLSDETIWEIGVFERNYDYYGAELRPMIQPLVGGQPDTSAVWFFLDFQDKDRANEYFRDYFTVYKEEISDYLNLHETTITDAPRGQSSGYTISGSGINWEISPEPNMPDISIEEDIYAGVINPLNNPYNNIVIPTELKGQTVTFEKDGKNVAIFVDGNYTLNNANTDLKVILATGDVTVSVDFDGLIISGGQVNINSPTSLSSNQAEVHAAYSATAEVDGEPYPFGKILGEIEVSDGLGSSGTGDSSTWELGELIVYENWQRK